MSDLSVALHAGRGDESVPLRPRQRCGICLQARADYQARLSGPLLDRIDLHIEVPAVTASDLILPPPSEGSREVGARDIQAKRYAAHGLPGIRTNAQASGPVLEDVARVQGGALTLLRDAADAMRLSARGYHRVLGSPAHWPISTVPKQSAASISRRRCPIAPWPTRCGAPREICEIFKELLTVRT